MRDALVPDCGRTENQIADIEVALQASGRADGNKGRCAQRRKVLQHRCRRRRPDPELAEQPYFAAGARQEHYPVRRGPALGGLQPFGPQHMVIEGTLVAQHDTGRGVIGLEPADAPQVGGESAGVNTDSCACLPAKFG